MANKKISQLTTAETIEAGDFFPLAEVAGSSYTTKKIDATGVAEYALNPISATQVSGLNKNFFINNNNSTWDTAGSDVELNPYLQVRQTDGQLVTGSGISVPSVGDNMGNCTATKTLDMQGNWLSGSNFSVTGVNDVYFNSASEIYGPRIEKGDDPGTIYDLKVQAGQDLTLSGLRYVKIKGNGLDLVDTPISGNVTFNNGDLTVAAGGSLTIDDITLRKRSVTTPHNNSTNTAVDWSASSIQYMTAPSNRTFTFSNTLEGQTLTMYVQNTAAADLTVGFPTTVKWGGEYSNVSPNLVNGKTTLYTFVKVNSAIFASAITGYVISIEP